MVVNRRARAGGAPQCQSELSLVSLTTKMRSCAPDDSQLSALGLWLLFRRVAMSDKALQSTIRRLPQTVDWQGAAPLFNGKAKDPSRLMHPSDGRRYRCDWLERSITIHSDGNVTCGLDDPHGVRSFGNVHQQSVADIFANPEYELMQRKLWNGHRCVDCQLYKLSDDENIESLPARQSHPTKLVIETTVRCNLRCPQPACIPNNDREIRTRDADFLDIRALKSVADQTAGKLSDVFFFNYGDPFVHQGAEEMLAHLRSTSPSAYIVTSTNGIPLAKPERAKRLVATEGLDRIVFTISGMTQESYSRYHIGGRLDLALRGMLNVMRAKQELGLGRPVVHWRYLVFNWNDRQAEIDAAIRIAEEYGIDDISLHLTNVPTHGASRRFAPGSPHFIRYRRYIENCKGYTADSPVPDRDGFYALEQTGLGPARWSGWQARKRLRLRGGRAYLSVSTNRPGSRKRENHVFIRTPWQTLKVPLLPEVWRTLELSVPEHVDLEIIEVEIVTFDYWFPAEEIGGQDLRCLGVLVSESDETNESPWGGYVPLEAWEVERLAGFRFESPEALVDN